MAFTSGHSQTVRFDGSFWLAGRWAGLSWRSESLGAAGDAAEAVVVVVVPGRAGVEQATECGEVAAGERPEDGADDTDDQLPHDRKSKDQQTIGPLNGQRSSKDPRPRSNRRRFRPACGSCFGSNPSSDGRIWA